MVILWRHHRKWFNGGQGRVEAKTVKKVLEYSKQEVMVLRLIWVVTVDMEISGKIFYLESSIRNL